MHKLSKHKENVSHHDHTTGRSTNHTYHYRNLNDHLELILNVELESRTQILLNPKIGRYYFDIFK